MDHQLHDLLSRVGWTAFSLSLGAWLLLNGGAAMVLWWRRDRTLVQKYTPWWLALNVLLIAIGVGVPAATAAAQLVVRVVQPVRATPSMFTAAQTINQTPIRGPFSAD